MPLKINPKSVFDDLEELVFFMGLPFFYRINNISEFEFRANNYKRPMFTTKIKIIEHIKYVFVCVCVCMVRNLYYRAKYGAR